MDNKELISQLYLCAATCDACYKGCLTEKDKDKLQRCMMLDKECYEICRLTASLLEINSENADKFLKLCAEICASCAQECDHHKYEHCQRCAAVCRKCSEMFHEYQPVN